MASGANRGVWGRLRCPRREVLLRQVRCSLLRPPITERLPVGTGESPENPRMKCNLLLSRVPSKLESRSPSVHRSLRDSFRRRLGPLVSFCLQIPRHGLFSLGHFAARSFYRFGDRLRSKLLRMKVRGLEIGAEVGKM